MDSDDDQSLEHSNRIGTEPPHHFDPPNSGSDRVQESRSDSLPKDSDRESADTACQQPDVLNWEDLIPVAPPRPSGRIQVRLKKARKDGPASADDPWAK